MVSAYGKYIDTILVHTMMKYFANKLINKAPFITDFSTTNILEYIERITDLRNMSSFERRAAEMV